MFSCLVQNLQVLWGPGHTGLCTVCCFVCRDSMAHRALVRNLCLRQYPMSLHAVWRSTSDSVDTSDVANVRWWGALTLFIDTPGGTA